MTVKDTNKITGLAMLMASAVVVLKHETSTLRQRQNFDQLISNLA